MSIDGIEGGENVTDWERASTLAVAAEGFQQGNLEERLAVKHPDWQARGIGKKSISSRCSSWEISEMDPMGERSTVGEHPNTSATQSWGKRRWLGIAISNRMILRDKGTSSVPLKCTKC